MGEPTLFWFVGLRYFADMFCRDCSGKIWAPPKAITLVTTFQPVLLDVVPQSHSM